MAQCLFGRLLLVSQANKVGRTGLMTLFFRLGMTHGKSDSAAATSQSLNLLVLPLVHLGRSGVYQRGNSLDRAGQRLRISYSLP